MAILDVYLNFAGNAEEAFKFYRSVFGGEFTSIRRFKDMPKQGGKVAKEEENKILNISLPIGGGSTISASDTLRSRGQRLIQGNNFYIAVNPETKKEADRLFDKLSEDGRVILPISDQPWNAYYGSFVDKFGVRWMVNYTYPQEAKQAKPGAARKAKETPAAKTKVKVKAKVKTPAPPKKKKTKAAVPEKKAPVKATAKPKSKTTVKKTAKPGAKVKATPVSRTGQKAQLAPKRKTTQKPQTKTKRELVGARGGKNHQPA